MNDKFSQILKELPAAPGVYIMRNKDKKVIYVGKASVLKNRVRQYFQKSRDVSPKVSLMMTYVDDLEWIVTASEVEALILECNLIKKHRPKYNIRLRDDKHYPYLKLTMDESFPRLLVVRRRGRDQGKYFGPYTSSMAMNETLNLIKELYPLRTCKAKEPKSLRPCLNYHIGKCLAPCNAKISKAAYREMVTEIIAILEGKRDDLLRKLTAKMQAYAENMEFEQAALVRNQIQALIKVTEKQKIDLDQDGNWDIIAAAEGQGEACAQIFFVRQGKVSGRKPFFMQGTAEHDMADVIAAFVEQFYAGTSDIPSEVIVSILPQSDRVAVLEQWLTQKRGTKVEIKLAQRGVKARLLQMVAENATLMLKTKLAHVTLDEKLQQGLLELQQAFNLPSPPKRMECFDISNIQGTNTVASMTVFIDGKPAPQAYRHFTVKTVEGPNDFASMSEVVGRRFKHGRQDEEQIDEGTLKKTAAKFYPFPDLLIIDGGKGQLGVAVEQMERYGLDIPIAGLAKKEEELFLPNQQEPLRLSRQSEGLKILQRLRDEAHRFAITYHRQKRGVTMTESAIDTIMGIGKKRRTALLNVFHSTARIAAASIEEIAKVPGMNKPLAQKIKQELNKIQSKD